MRGPRRRTALPRSGRHVSRARRRVLGRYGTSSFSRILAEYRKIDSGDGWYSACPGRLPRHYAADEINGSLYSHWSLCPQNCTALPPHVQMHMKDRGSFGYNVMCMHGTGPPEMQEPRHHHHHEAEWRRMRRRRAR